MCFFFPLTWSRLKKTFVVDRDVKHPFRIVSVNGEAEQNHFTTFELNAQAQWPRGSELDL